MNAWRPVEDKEQKRKGKRERCRKIERMRKSKGKRKGKDGREGWKRRMEEKESSLVPTRMFPKQQ